MSGNPSIVVRFATNVREFLTGTDQVERALDDLGDETTDLARGVERDTERMERAFREAGRDIERTADRTGREASRDLRKVTREGGAEAGRETGAEFAQNLGESLSSGDITSIGADTAGGLISGFTSMGGPIGYALAGAAVPITAWFADRRAEAEAFRETVRTLFDIYRSESDTIAADLREAKLDQLFADLGDDAAAVFDSLRAYGVSDQTLADALSGDADALADIETAADRARDAADGTTAGLVGVGKGLNSITNVAGLDSLFPEEDAVNRLLTAAGAVERIADADRRAYETARLRTRLGNTAAAGDPGYYVLRPGTGRRD